MVLVKFLESVLDCGHHVVVFDGTQDTKFRVMSSLSELPRTRYGEVPPIDFFFFLCCPDDMLCSQS